MTDEPLSRAEVADEYLLMGLRLAEGIDLIDLKCWPAARSHLSRSPILRSTVWSKQRPPDACVSRRQDFRFLTP